MSDSLLTATGLPGRSTDASTYWWSVLGVTLLMLAGLLGLEFTSVDIWLAGLSYDAAAQKFPLRDHFFTTRVSHDAFKLVSAAVFAWILVGALKPIGLLGRLDRPARVYLLVAAVVCLAVVALLKRGSALHCVWDLEQFGGTQPYLRLFDQTPVDWQRGRCFPGGHALSAFCYVGGYFAWRAIDPRIGRRWLAMVVVLGLWAGLSQQLRGAHFLSHTLWTAWLCWALSAGLAWLVRHRLRPAPPTVTTAAG